MKNCPNCQTELKSGLRSSSEILSPLQTGIINEYHENNADGYCTICGTELYAKYYKILQNEKTNLSKYMRENISSIPVVSTHSPLNWDYKVLGMVTGQSTTGTGAITEFTSIFTDLFGEQSKRHNQKLKAGENMCFVQLRKLTLDLGGNAVIATDIDYSEVGSGKGMLMVCMTGTAISLNNMEVLQEGQSEILGNLAYSNKRLKILWSLINQT